MAGEHVYLPDGGKLELVASTHAPDRSKLPPVSEVSEITWRSWWKKDYPCGHRDARKFILTVKGVKSVKIVGSDKCPVCALREFVETTIRCALCGLPIFQGEPVALIGKDCDGVRADAVHSGDNAVICMRMDCCPSGGLFCGHWDGKDIKPIKWLQ
jgi:hypothetical protein